MTVMPNSPPPSLGSAIANSSLILESNLAISYRDGNVGNTGNVLALSSSRCTAASGNKYCNGDANLSYDASKNDFSNGYNPLCVDSSPRNAVHSKLLIVDVDNIGVLVE